MDTNILLIVFISISSIEKFIQLYSFIKKHNFIGRIQNKYKNIKKTIKNYILRKLINEEEIKKLYDDINHNKKIDDLYTLYTSEDKNVRETILNKILGTDIDIEEYDEFYKKYIMYIDTNVPEAEMNIKAEYEKFIKNRKEPIIIPNIQTINNMTEEINIEIKNNNITPIYDYIDHTMLEEINIKKNNMLDYTMMEKLDIELLTQDDKNEIIERINSDPWFKA